jgi:hypothetical protein
MARRNRVRGPWQTTDQALAAGRNAFRRLRASPELRTKAPKCANSHTGQIVGEPSKTLACREFQCQWNGARYIKTRSTARFAAAIFSSRLAPRARLSRRRLRGGCARSLPANPRVQPRGRRKTPTYSTSSATAQRVGLGGGIVGARLRADERIVRPQSELRGKLSHSHAPPCSFRRRRADVARRVGAVALARISRDGRIGAPRTLRYDAL